MTADHPAFCSTASACFLPALRITGYSLLDVLLAIPTLLIGRAMDRFCQVRFAGVGARSAPKLDWSEDSSFWERTVHLISFPPGGASFCCVLTAQYYYATANHTNQSRPPLKMGKFKNCDKFSRCSGPFVRRDRSGERIRKEHCQFRAKSDILNRRRRRSGRNNGMSKMQRKEPS